MKNRFLLFIPAGILLFLFLSMKPEIQPVPGFPEDIDKLLISSCYDCHSSDSKNTDAKEAIDFQKWNEYKLSKKVGLLEDICEMIEAKKMPPEKYLGHKPDRKLSDEQIKKICDWAEKESETLMGEK